MSLTIRVLIGLMAGFLLGLALTGAGPSIAAAILAVATPVGTVFVNLIRMTVIPLVVSMLVANVGAMTASGSLGRTGMRAALIAIALLTVAAAIAILVASPVLARVQVDRAAALSLRGGQMALGGGPANSASGLAQWFVDL